MTAAQSVDAVSEDFLALQARANDDGTITTDVADITLYPYEHEWTLRYELGDPFDGWLARETLDTNTKFAGIPALLERINPDELSFDQVTTITINRNPDDTSILASQDIEQQMNDVCIEIDGRTATMSEIPTVDEYYAEKENDMDDIQQRIETEMRLYRDIQNADTPEYRIEDIETPTESTIRLILGQFKSQETLPIEIDLPMADEITTSPVTEFINALGCGKIADLKHEWVYLYKQTDETLGCDTRFDTYGVSATPIETTDSKSLFSRLLG